MVTVEGHATVYEYNDRMECPLTHNACKSLRYKPETNLEHSAYRVDLLLTRLSKAN